MTVNVTSASRETVALPIMFWPCIGVRGGGVNHCGTEKYSLTNCLTDLKNRQKMRPVLVHTFISNVYISKANQILCAVSLGGEGCIRVWGRSDQNPG